MKDIELLHEAAKAKLTGYTEKEIDCFIQGEMYMAGNLPQPRSEEWYARQAERKAEGAARADAVCEIFKDVTGLGAAVDNIKAGADAGSMTDRMLNVLMTAIIGNPQYRAQFLQAVDAEEAGLSREIIQAIRIGISSFNEKYDIQLDFRQLEENEGRWTFFWCVPL